MVLCNGFILKYFIKCLCNFENIVNSPQNSIRKIFSFILKKYPNWNLEYWSESYTLKICYIKIQN